MEENKITSFNDLLDEIPQPEKEKKTYKRTLFKIGQITSIKAFKYDGTLYRQYEGAKIVANLEDFVVVLLIKSKVSEENINWVVSDPILFFFAKNHFYNAVITLNKKKDNYIYINLASPFYIEDGIIKYIDFDIDIKSYVNKDFNVVDWQDFKKSIVQYKYPVKLIYRVYEELDFLQEQHYGKSGIFSKNLVDGIKKMLIESGDI
ncbi:DUF402 domain-containing protein [Mycoplasma phocoeninasale]|uniref:DUF402 domain-containing protein n=1 Tax=Mycoplasma phocoeninasale TaxID=2726117 RepID=A0A858U6S3_9MOLU|nr:DUF402 domain-containing protein [Mycoplasma phocoeninasale]QJG66426.1 DUF402 domain-containing protein [Mycoplasma phocoeninasale]